MKAKEAHALAMFCAQPSNISQHPGVIRLQDMIRTAVRQSAELGKFKTAVVLSPAEVVSVPLIRTLRTHITAWLQTEGYQVEEHACNGCSECNGEGRWYLQLSFQRLVTTAAASRPEYS